MILSILIPTIRRHDRFLTSLKTELYSQILPYAGEVEILIDDHETDPTGTKRNRLLQRAKGKMTASFDSDDWPSGNYIKHMMEAVESGCDCASLRGMYSIDGKDDGMFEHSLKYPEWKTTTNPIKYERYPTPLNAIKTEIAQQFKFPEITFGEDHAWSKLLNESGLLKTEHYIDEIIYNYRYVSNKQ